MYTNILIPYDGSESANRALATAVELGSGTDESVQITVLHVRGVTDFDNSTFEVALQMAGLDPSAAQKVEELQENYMSVENSNLQEKVEAYFGSLPENIDVKIVVRRGNPRDVICDYAEQNEIDCIIMGRRGLNGIRAALGSVSGGVLRSTDLPVLVVK